MAMAPDTLLPAIVDPTTGRQWQPGGNTGGSPVMDPNTTAPATSNNGLATSYLAPYFGSYVSDMLGRAQGISNLPFQPYTGDRFAGPSTLQQQAFQGLGSLTVPGQFQQATDIYGQTAQNIGQFRPDMVSANMPGEFQNAAGAYGQAINRIGAYAPQQIGQQLDAGDLSTVNRFMSPYQQNVTDAAIRRSQQRFNEAQGGRNAEAARARAFGGARHGLTEGVAVRGQQDLEMDTGYRGAQDAFTAAQNAINQQRASDLQAAIANQNASLNAYQTGISGLNQAGSGLTNLGTAQVDPQLRAAMANQNAGLSAYQTGVSGLSNIAAGLGSIGTQQGTMQSNILRDQLAGGTTQQGFAQQPLDFGYQQWEQSQRYPFETLNWQRNMLQGLPLEVKPATQTNPMLEGLMGAGGLYSLLYPAKTPG